MSSEFDQYFEDALHDLGDFDFDLYYGNSNGLDNQKFDESSDTVGPREGLGAVNVDELGAPPLQRAPLVPQSSSDQSQPS